MGVISTYVKLLPTDIVRLVAQKIDLLFLNKSKNTKCSSLQILILNYKAPYVRITTLSFITFTAATFLSKIMF